MNSDNSIVERKDNRPQTPLGNILPEVGIGVKDQFHEVISPMLYTDSIAISPDGRYMATGSYDGNVRIWDIKSRKLLKILAGHRTGTPVDSVSFSANGKRLATGSWDHTARVWDTESWNCICTITHIGEISTGHLEPASINSVILNTDGTKLFVGGRGFSGNLRCYDVSSGNRIMTYEGHTNSVFSLSLSKDETKLVTGSADNTAKLWDVFTGRCLMTYIGHKDWISTVFLSHDGEKVVTGSRDNAVILWDTNSGERLVDFIGHSKDVEAVCISNDGKSVITGSSDFSFRIWNAKNGNCIKDLDFGHVVEDIVLSDDDKHIFVVGMTCHVECWDLENQDSIMEYNDQFDEVTSLQLSSDGPDGNLLTVGSDNGMIKLFDITTGKLKNSFKGHDDTVTSVSLSKDNSLLATGSRDGTGKVWNTNYECIRIFSGPIDIALPVCISPDGKWLVMSGENNTVKRMDISTGNCLNIYKGHTKDIWSIFLSADGKQMVTGGADGIAKRWDIDTEKCLMTYKGHDKLMTYKGHDKLMKYKGHDKNIIRSVFLSTDKKIVVTGCTDKTAKLWDAETGKCLKTFEHSSLYVFSVFLSNDNKHLFTVGSGSYEKFSDTFPYKRYYECIIWDANSGSKIVENVGHQGRILSACLSPDETRLITGSYDKTIRFWDTKTGELLATLYNLQDGYLWTTPSELHSIENGELVTTLNEKGKYFYTDREDLIDVFEYTKEDKSDCRILSEDDPKRKRYFEIYNDWRPIKDILFPPEDPNKNFGKIFDGKKQDNNLKGKIHKPQLSDGRSDDGRQNTQYDK